LSAYIKAKNIMNDFLKIFRLIKGVRALLGEESLISNEIIEKRPILYRVLKTLLFIQKNKGGDLSKVFIKLGPTWVKLGQFLSTRPDIIGIDLSSKLKTLQDSIEPFENDKAIAILKKEFGPKYEEIFIDVKPSETAASIAQVHKGKINHNNNELFVAIKILRPGIEKSIKKDLQSFFVAAKLLEKISHEAKRLRLIEVVKTLSDSLGIEIDLRLEAAAQSEIKDNTNDDNFFDVPSIIWDYTGKNILISEWVDAIPAKNICDLKKKNYNLKKIGENILKTFLTLSIRDGLFHADMHQGNLFIDKNEKIIAVDFGIVGYLDFESKQYLNNILLGFINRDYDKIAKIHFDAGYISEKEDRKKFSQALRSIGEPIQGRNANDISIGKLLTQLFEITNQFNMRTQPQLLLLQKTMVVVEGVAREYDTNLNIWSQSEPILNELNRLDFSKSKNISQETQEIINRAKETIINLPNNIEGVKKNLDQLGKIIDYQGIKIHPDSINNIKTKDTNLLFYFAIILLIGLVLIIMLL